MFSFAAQKCPERQAALRFLLRCGKSLSYAPAAALAVWMVAGTAAVAQTPSCTGSRVFPCNVGGTLLVSTRPTLFFNPGFGSTGGSGKGAYINNAQNPGFSATASVPLTGHGPSLPSGSTMLNLAAVSGKPDITGLTASITCGVTASAAFSMSLMTPLGDIVLNCPGTANEGDTITVTEKITFRAATSSLVVNMNFSGRARLYGDTVTVATFSAQVQVNAPVIPPPPGARFIPVTPCRVADTRLTNGPFGGPSITSGGIRDFTIPNGVCGIPSTAAAYSLNVAVVPHGRLAFLTMWPSGKPQAVVATLNSVDGRIKSNAAIVPAGANGAVSVYATDTTDVILDINGYFVGGTNASALAFYPLTPCRVADTRNPTGFLGGPFLAAQSARSFPLLASSCGLPANAKAYSLNFAAVPKGSQLGFLTAWPTGQPRPVVASLNDTTGTIAANAVVVPAGTNGEVSVYATDATDLVIDINGYFAPQGPGGLSLYTLTPCRVLDSRFPPGAEPLRVTRDVNITAAACGAPATAQAFVLNATVIPEGVLGYITMWSQGQAQPLAATLNAVDGEITNNMAIVPSTTGSISVYPSAPTHLVLDIFGYFAP